MKRNIYEYMVLIWLGALVAVVVTGCGIPVTLPATPSVKIPSIVTKSQTTCSYSTTFNDSAGSNPITLNYQLTTMANGDTQVSCGAVFDYVSGTYNTNYILSGTSGDATCSVIRDLSSDGFSYSAALVFDATKGTVTYSVPSPGSADDVALNGTVWTIPPADCN